MGVAADEDFISSFHSLSGLTLGERRKNLLLLLNKTKNPGEINVSLQPKTPLEEVLKVETLIYFRKIPDLLNVLKSGNPILIQKVLKVSSWFIEEASEGVTGEELVTEVFPNISYNTKLKLLNKLSYLKNTQRADEFFEAIKETYGVYLASKLLPACSGDLIMRHIEANRTEITPRQLLVIIKKYPALTESIFEKLTEHNGKIRVGDKYKYVFVYLVQNDSALFLKLKEKYNPSFNLGSRATKKFIGKNKLEIIKNAQEYQKLLKEKRIGRSLKAEFKDFYCNYFPKSISQLEERLEDYLSSPLLDHLLSDAKKLDLVLKTFQVVQGYELWDYPDFITPEVIEMMSVEDRENWMQTRSRPKEISEETWISFMKTDKSIPLLKKKISFTSNIKERTKLVISLVKTCKINQDNKALLDVCEYMVSQHRNDHIRVRRQFLTVLTDSFNLKKLELEHWKCINQFMHLLSVTGHLSEESPRITKAYIYYCLEKNLPIEERYIVYLIKSYNGWDICKNNLKFEKRYLIMLGNFLPLCFKDNDSNEELENCYIDYLNNIVNWNRRHPNDNISLFINNNAIDAVKLRLLNSDYRTYYAEEVALQCIITDYEKSQKANLIEAFFNIKKPTYTTLFTMVKWSIKNQPLIFLNHVEHIVRNIAKMSTPFSCFTCIYKYYTHLEIPQKIAEVCLKIINTDEDPSTKKCAVYFLSSVMTPEQFLKYTAAYYPSDLTPEVESKEGQNIYQMQQAILPCLRNINPPSLALECLLNFCKGDYLKLVQKSLHLVAHNTAENKLVPFLNTLSARAVSVRKHALFLAFRDLNKAEIYLMLNRFMETEKNLSIRKILFRLAFNFFTRNPDDYSWQLVKQNLKAVDVNDKEAFDKLTKCRKVSSGYFAQYVLFTWDILENHADSTNIEEGKCRILAAVTSTTILMLPKEFCENIIEKYFFKSGLTKFQRKIYSFTCKYIIYCQSRSEQEERMKLTFVILKNYVNSSSYKKNTNEMSLKSIFNFVKEFCADFLDEKCLNKEIFQMFIASWNDLLKPNEAFDEYLFLQFTSIYIDYVLDDSLTIPQIGERLALLCESLHDKGFLSMSIFWKAFSQFKINFLDEERDKDEDHLILIESIIKGTSSPSCLALATTLLPTAFIGPKLQLKYSGIIALITKSTDPMVQAHLRSYLKNEEVDEDEEEYLMCDK